MRRREAVAVIGLLFDIAFAELSRCRRWGSASIARGLLDRILLDVTGVMNDERHGTVALEQWRVNYTKASEQHITPRETRVLEGLLSTRSRRQLAASLGVSEKTIRNHITSIRRKIPADGQENTLQ